MHYLLDVLIALSFVVSAVSGLLLFIMPEGGYQGGRNPHYGWEIMFLDEHGWKDLHTWGSLVMTAGVAAHLALHWSWLVKVTRNFFRKKIRGENHPHKTGGGRETVGAGPQTSPALQTR
jgi:hypothetical protein